MLYLYLGKLIHDERQREIEATLERRRLLEDRCDEPVDALPTRRHAVTESPCGPRQEVARSAP